jgi:hypothetical protein
LLFVLVFLFSHLFFQITLARRLYQPDVELSADKFIKLQRRFALFFVVLRDNPEVVSALERVEKYDNELKVKKTKDFAKGLNHFPISGARIEGLRDSNHAARRQAHVIV